MFRVPVECGHVFHHRCLQDWMSCSNSCPKCRGYCPPNMVRRIYFNISNGTPLPLPLQADVEPIRGFDWFALDNTLSDEDIAKFAFQLDSDDNGDPIYAARVNLYDDLLPAYYVSRKKGVYCVWNCLSHFLEENVQLLHVDNDDAEYKWVAAKNGVIPEGALAAGYSETGETLYISRTHFEGRLRYGKLHPSHGCCYVPYKDAEENNNIYEVLVRVPK